MEEVTWSETMDVARHVEELLRPAQWTVWTPLSPLRWSLYSCQRLALLNVCSNTALLCGNNPQCARVLFIVILCLYLCAYPVPLQAAHVHV